MEFVHINFCREVCELVQASGYVHDGTFFSIKKMLFWRRSKYAYENGFYIFLDKKTKQESFLPSNYCHRLSVPDEQS